MKLKISNAKIKDKSVSLILDADTYVEILLGLKLVCLEGVIYG